MKDPGQPAGGPDGGPVLGVLAACVLWMAPAGGDLRAEEDPATASLVESFIRQAKAVADTAPRPRDGEALRGLVEEIDAKRKTWERRLTQGLGETELLAGLPAALLARVSAAASSSEQSAALLQEAASLPLAMALAAARNPEARVALEALRASTRRFQQASYLEELIAQYRAFVRELDTKVGPQSHKEMPEKTFAFPSALALKGQAIDLEVELARLRYLESVRKAINAAARGFFTVQYTERQIPILKENRELFSKMDSIATEQLKVGRVSQADSLRAQSELAMLDTQLLTAERERTNGIAQVNAVLGLPPEAPWGNLVPTDLDEEAQALPALLEVAGRNNQALLRAGVEVELMQTMVRMAETMVLPRGSQGASLLAPSTGAEAGPTRAEMAAFPVMRKPSTEQAGFGANAAYLDELRVRVQEALRMRDAAQAEVAFMVKDAHFMADTASRERKTLAEAVVPKARQALATYRERYNTAAAPFIEYLDAARLYLSSSLNLEKARLEHNRALTGLEDACGRSAVRLLPGSREGRTP